MQGSESKCYVKRDKALKGWFSHSLALEIPGLELRNAPSPWLRYNSGVRVRPKCWALRRGMEKEAYEKKKNKKEGKEWLGKS